MSGHGGDPEIEYHADDLQVLFETQLSVEVVDEEE